MSQTDPSGTAHVEHDTPMTATYVGVVVLEALIIVALWIFGRVFS
jgi:hypothetical protein